MSKIVKCHYCGGRHSCRGCPIEKTLAPYMRKLVGESMEKFVAEELCCPQCSAHGSLKMLGTHAPSLDIVCTSCNANFEVKSKCLSGKIPNNLIFNHGNYYDYVARSKSGLNFIFIIYSVNRTSKVLTIKNVYYHPHYNNDVQVIKKSDSHLSDIIVKNISSLREIQLEYNYDYDFSNNIIQILKNYQQIIEARQISNKL
jgi:hypothetical protein